MTLGSGAQVFKTSTSDAAMLIFDHLTQGICSDTVRTVDCR